VHHNTLVNTVASFERTERSAVGDHFGWHPATGPDVDQRHGHVFVDNLLTADRGFPKPLLRFEQPKALCERLTRPQVTRLDGNVYVRGGDAAARALIVWSPMAGEVCQIELASLDELQKIDTAFEAHGQYLRDDLASVFKSPELGNYALIRALGASVADSLPPDIRKLLGWSERRPLSAGAY
jgi:hypothetical protein